jgi:hypothetical protein
MNTKLLLFFLLLVFGLMNVNAQTSTFIAGDKVLNLGVGFGNYNSGYNVVVPPVSVSFEVGLKGNFLDKGVIGLGGYLAYASYKEADYTAENYWTNNKTVIEIRGTLHYPLVEKLDTYGGLMLGYQNDNWKWHGSGTQDKTNGTGLALALLIGGRYYFTDRIAAMAEIGLAISILNIGVAIKF